MTAELYHVVIVDDEFHARKLLSEYVSKLPMLTLVETAANAFEAMNLLHAHQVDILLLDINMPDITGMEFARSLKNAPEIIFTTAYSEYAVESYEVNAIDYILKPIAFPRFIQAINKAIEHIAQKKQLQQPLQSAQTAPASQANEEQSLVVKSGTKVYKIVYNDIIYIEGQREYVTFHTNKSSVTALFALKELEQILPGTDFIRIHKSFIVAVKQIDYIEKTFVSIKGKKFPVGGVYRDLLFERFNL